MATVGGAYNCNQVGIISARSIVAEWWQKALFFPSFDLPTSSMTTIKAVTLRQVGAASTSHHPASGQRTRLYFERKMSH